MAPARHRAPVSAAMALCLTLRSASSAFSIVPGSTERFRPGVWVLGATCALSVLDMTWPLHLHQSRAPRPYESRTGAVDPRSDAEPIYPQVSLGFSNDTVTWPLAAMVKWSTSRY